MKMKVKSFCVSVAESLCISQTSTATLFIIIKKTRCKFEHNKPCSQCCIWMHSCVTFHNEQCKFCRMWVFISFFLIQMPCTPMNECLYKKERGRRIRQRLFKSIKINFRKSNNVYDTLNHVRNRSRFSTHCTECTLDWFVLLILSRNYSSIPYFIFQTLHWWNELWILWKSQAELCATNEFYIGSNNNTSVNTFFGSRYSFESIRCVYFDKHVGEFQKDLRPTHKTDIRSYR